MKKPKEKEHQIYTNGLGTFWGEDGNKIAEIDVATIYKRGRKETLAEVEKRIYKLQRIAGSLIHFADVLNELKELDEKKE